MVAGVGGGMHGLDFGLGFIVSSAQDVVIAGQLNTTATPWVVRYFVEYMGASSGIFPVGAPGVAPNDPVR